MDRSHERDALHGPWPTRPEEVAAQYADKWVIYRELHPSGTHGEWIAEPRQPADGVPEKITAGDIESLAEKLATAET